MKQTQPHTTVVAVLALIGVLLATAMPPAPAQSRRQRPFNRIVILIDRSGSFQSKLPDAREIAWKYVRTLANTSQEDECYVLGVDAEPSEIAYIRGVRSRRRSQEQFDAAFGVAAQGLGTDWVTALQKAANILALPPTPGACHLLVFGDLCVDDAKDAESRRLIRRFVRLDQFDWSALAKVSGSLWFVDSNVRDQLMAVPGFSGLGFQVNSVESDARVREIEAPRRVRDGANSQASDSAGQGSVVPWVIGLAIALAAYVVLTRRPADGRNRQ